jgi:hypothetical protein
MLIKEYFKKIARIRVVIVLRVLTKHSFESLLILPIFFYFLFRHWYKLKYSELIVLDIGTGFGVNV